MYWQKSIGHWFDSGVSETTNCFAKEIFFLPHVRVELLYRPVAAVAWTSKTQLTFGVL
jgi:hypothetical protein